MRLFGWFRQPAQVLVPGPDLTSPCRHVWSNWTEPHMVEVNRQAFIGGVPVGPPQPSGAYQQDRRCLSCNQFESRVIDPLSPSYP